MRISGSTRAIALRLAVSPRCKSIVSCFRVFVRHVLVYHGTTGYLKLAFGLAVGNEPRVWKIIVVCLIRSSGGVHRLMLCALADDKLPTGKFTSPTSF